MDTFEHQIVDYPQKSDWVTAEQISGSIEVKVDRVEAKLEDLLNRGQVDYCQSGHP